MNNSEHRTNVNRQPPEIKRSFIDTLEKLFSDPQFNKGPQVENYLKKDPGYQKSTMAEVRQTRQQQQDSLGELKRIVTNLPEAQDRELLTQNIVKLAKNTATELSHKLDIQAFQTSFYKEVVQLPIAEEFALPYARFVAASIDLVDEANMLSSAKHKAQLALEIFIAETGQTVASLPVLKQILQTIQLTHSYPDIAQYFQSEEFRKLCGAYGITQEQTQDLLEGLQQSVEIQSNHRSETTEESIPQFREKVMDLLSDPHQAVLADTYLLSLTPLQYMQLTRAVVQQERLGDGQALTQFKEQMLTLVPGLTPENKTKIEATLLSYYRSMADNLYQSFDKIAPDPRSSFAYLSQQLNVLNKITDMDDQSLSAYTEFAPVLTAYAGSQMFVEYYRGKVAQLFQEQIVREKQGLSEAQYLQQLLSSGQELTISSDRFEDLFKEARKLALLASIQEEYSVYFRQYEGLVTKYKTDPYVKAQLSFGNRLNIAFEYQNLREDSFLGEERLRQIETVRQTSLAYVVPLYLKGEVGAIIDGFKGLKEVENAALKGDPAAFKAAAELLSNETGETLMAMPEVRTAYQTYLSILKRRLAANGNVLTPDLFKVDRSYKNALDYQLEQELKYLYPEMTDEERSIISTLGKGLTIAKGDFLYEIAHATPPIRSTLDKLETGSGKVADVIKKMREGREAPTMAEFALVKEVLKETFSPSFHDFPFRELLFTLNPQKWFAFWVVIDDYNLTNLAFAPIKLGERMSPVSQRWQTGYEVWRALVYGIPNGNKGDEIAKIIDKQLVPALALDDLSTYMSVGRRGGWRNDAFFYTSEDLEPSSNDQYDLERSFEKILRQRGPTAAWQFVKSGLHRVDFGKKLTDDEKKAFEQRSLEKIMVHFQENSPSFFLSHERGHFFRQGESFIESVEQVILSKVLNQDQAILAFLSTQEREKIKIEAQFYGKGGENLVRSRRIYDRLLSTVEFVQQTFILEGLAKHGRTFKEFIQDSDRPEFQLIKQKTLKYLEEHVRSYYNLPVDSQDLFAAFVDFNRQIFYNQNSLFNTHKVAGLGNKETELKKYYSNLILQKKLDPFGWEYLYDKDLFFQEIGSKLISRNLGDLGTYLEVTKGFGDLTKAIVAAIQKKNQREGYELVRDEIKKLIPAFKGFKGVYGDEAAYKAATVMLGYVGSVFRGPMVKDLPLIGKIIPFSESYATLSYPDDKWKQASWGTAVMKELIDTLDKEGLFPYGKSNFRIEGMSETLQVPVGNKVWKFKLPEKIFGVILPNQLHNLPAQALSTILPAKFFPGLYRSYGKTGAGEFSVDNIRKWLNVDEKYVTLNMISTVLVVGFLMMLFAAIKEGMKEGEIK